MVRSIAVRFTTLAVATLVGLGVCACEPQEGTGLGGEGAAAVGAKQSTEQDATPKPTRTTAPAGKPKPSSKTKPPTTRPSPTRSTSSSGGCPQGEWQREVEGYLARLGGYGTVTVDGRQSAADCAAIKKFQRRFDIRPAKGRAGPTTVDVARRLANTDTSKCRAGTGTTFCVNLTLQTVWAMRDGKVVMGPTVARTGMRGYATPAGTYTINFRNKREWSDPYEVWLPYWQRFIGGIGFHQTTTYLHNKSIGSHGCVNLLPQDAARLWELGRVGLRVHVFGRRPGT